MFCSICDPDGSIFLAVQPLAVEPRVEMANQEMMSTIKDNNSPNRRDNYVFAKRGEPHGHTTSGKSWGKASPQRVACCEHQPRLHALTKEDTTVLDRRCDFGK